MTYGFFVPLRRSLRLRLLLASLVVEAIMLTALVGNAVRLVDEHLVRNTMVREKIHESSYNIILADILASRDYSQLQSMLDGWGANGSVSYMVVLDAGGNRVIASTGLAAGAALPPADTVISPRSDIYHGEFPVTFLGQVYGQVRYGLDTTFLGVARNDMLRQSVAFAVGETALTAALLASIGYLLTRNLAALTRAAINISKGDLTQRITTGSGDEVGVLGDAFNVMSEAVESRLVQLQQSQERFRAIADYTYSWENWFGADGQLRWVNPAVKRVSGFSPDDCYAMPDFPLPLVVPEDREAVKAALSNAFCGNLSVKDMEFRIVRKDGEVIWAAMSWLPIYDNSGLSLGVRASIRDVTDEKQSFDAMLTAKSELERMLFAASHDLREPLREILIFSQLLQRQLGGTLPEPAGQSLSAIRRGAEQMGALVQGLMAFSRSGRTMTSFEVIDCRAVVESAVSQCADGSSEVRFEIGPLPKLPGDGALLLIMFENLICNAIKFRRTDAPAWVKISAEAEADGWRIDVADNGIGMAEVDLQTIVRPFSRVHPRASFPGAGLGLASATRVAGIHGGRLWLDSTLGEGTTAHVWLPTASEHVTSAATCPA